MAGADLYCGRISARESTLGGCPGWGPTLSRRTATLRASGASLLAPSPAASQTLPALRPSAAWSDFRPITST